MARLFVALYPPRELARGLLDTLAGCSLPPHRVTPLEQVHMTLLFIGEVPERELGATADSVERAAAGVEAFDLTVEGLFPLPERGPARLIAAGTDTPGALLELRRRLVPRLVAPRSKQTPFRPHLTLCRFRAPTRYELPPLELALEPFRVDSISLQRSILLPEGAEHRQVLRVPLRAS